MSLTSRFDTGMTSQSNPATTSGIPDAIQVKSNHNLFTWLAETAVSVCLVDADAVDAGGRIASGQFLFAMEPDKTGRAGAMGPAVMGDQARAAIMADHRITSVELFLAKLSFVTW